MQVWKTTGTKPKQLAEAPPLPEELSYVWDWFQELFAGTPLSYTEIKSWSDLRKVELSHWESELIKDLDRDFWSIQNDGRHSEPRTTGKKPRGRGRR